MLSSAPAGTNGTLAFDRHPVVLDTNVVFYDPDDIMMLIAAARTVRRLFVVTADEVRGYRARVARAVLDSLGRTDVPVIQGEDLESDRIMLPEVCAALPEPPMVSLIDRMSALCEFTTGPVIWVGCGPMTNLVAILEECPELAERFAVTQMGGWLDPNGYRDPSRSSHNFRVDTRAAGIALRMCHGPRLVLSEHTGVPDVRITPESPLYHRLSVPDVPEWARLAALNFSAWFERRPTGSWMHDPITLAAALDLPFVSFRDERIRIEGDMRLYPDAHGRTIRVSDGVQYPALMTWLEGAVHPGTHTAHLLLPEVSE